MAADIERLIIDWIKARITAARILTDLPANLADVLPVIQVGRSGGTTPLPRIDVAFVDVDCYAASRDAASTLSRQLHDLMLRTLPGYSTAAATVLSVDTQSGPSWRPYDNTTLRRFGASYDLRVKSL
jgi:hypothetical protein